MPRPAIHSTHVFWDCRGGQGLAVCFFLGGGNLTIEGCEGKAERKIFNPSYLPHWGRWRHENFSCR